MHSLLCRMGSVLAWSHEVHSVEPAPVHVWHVELHERHALVPLSSNCPMAHVEVHVPAPGSNKAPVTHDEQPVAVPSEQVAHVGSHALHVLFASAYLPLGQPATHEPSSKYCEPLLGHVRQAEECAPEHVSHELWQLVHVAWLLPTISTNSPVLAHVLTHAPLDRKGAAVPLHVMQSLLAGPLHVPHVEWHGAHTPELLAYLPTGVHESRQVPSRVP